MAYQKKYKKRYGKKRGGWTARKQAKKGKGDQGVRFFKLRAVFEAPVDSNSGFAMYSSLRAPTKSVDGSNVIGDWTACASLFDSYRVHGHKIKWIPAFDSTGVSFKPMYVYTDFDNLATGLPVSTVQGVIDYENCSIKNFNRPWSRYVKVPKTVNGSGGDAAGYTDIGAPLDQGVHCIYAPDVGQGLTTGDILGTFVVIYYCSFKNRR